MNIRHYLPRLIAVTAVAVLTATSSCFGVVLNVPQYNQEQDQWCWNASCQMILASQGHTYSQTDIANWAVGGRNVPNYLYNSPDSSRKGCDEVLSHFGNISSSGSGSAISLSTLANEIANSRPVMIGWSWDSGGGHAVVLRGTDGSSVYVNDPWPSNGQSVQTYDWVCRPYNQGTWSQTLQLSNGGSTTYYEYCLYYYSLYQQYYSRYQSSGSYEDMAYANYYYAYAIAYFYLYNGDSSSATAYYNYYMQLAQYYYNLYLTQAYYAYYYSRYYSFYLYYYSYWKQTGDYYYLVYTCYYYANAVYCYYMYCEDSSSATYYYNYWMAWAEYYYYNYYNQGMSGVGNAEIPAA